VLQTVREGSATAIQTLLADLRAEGHIESAAEAEMMDGPEHETDPELDSELDLGDEDQAVLESWDGEKGEQGVAVCALGTNAFESAGSELVEKAGLEIIVEGNTCRLHLPSWAGFESRTELGQRILDELGNRFAVLERVAIWLSGARKQFLVSADPWDLGCSALQEMRSGQVPVSPQSFLELSGFKKLAKPEAFSRYTRECFLVWPDATEPLSILFGPLARQAWVGNVIKQLSREQGRMLSARDLEELRGIAKPRSKSERERLHLASVDSLGFSELLMRAISFANIGLSEVLAVYGEHIIMESHE